MTTDLAFPRIPFAPANGPERFGAWIGVSDSLTELFAQLREVTRTRDALIVEGELGVGKRSLLLQVHDAAIPVERPLVVVDCAAVPSHLAEAEIFGSGGVAGALQRATGGDLLLAEIALLPLRVQWLLAERFAGASILPRLMATSRLPLAEECERGRFAQALFDLVSPHRFTLPPLRARREDILPLAVHFHSLSQPDSTSTVNSELMLTADEIEALLNHDWPGNARELRNVIERTMRRDSRTPGVLPVGLRPSERVCIDFHGFEPERSYRETRAKFEADFEMHYVRWLLDRHSGNISAASREARMDRKYLYDLARKHGLRGHRQTA